MERKVHGGVITARQHWERRDCLWVSMHTHMSTAEMTLVYSCVSQSKQQLFASKSASLESGSNAVFGWNHIDRVSSTTGAVRRGTLCLSFFLFSFSLSQPLFFHKECVSHIVRCVSISNCSDGWRRTNRKEEWDGNQVSRIEEKELFYYNSITALSALRHGWRKTITQPAHAMKNETSSDIQNGFVLDEDKQSGYVCIHYIKSIAKPYQNNTSKIIKRGEKNLAKAILNSVSVLDKWLCGNTHHPASIHRKTNIEQDSTRIKQHCGAGQSRPGSRL